MRSQSEPPFGAKEQETIFGSTTPVPRAQFTPNQFLGIGNRPGGFLFGQPTVLSVGGVTIPPLRQSLPALQPEILTPAISTANDEEPEIRSNQSAVTHDNPPRLQEPQRKRRKSTKKQWTDEECFVLLYCAKRLVHCDLKTITEAACECFQGREGQDALRSAEKKLKRLLKYTSWKRTKTQVLLERIEENLVQFDKKQKLIDSKVEAAIQSALSKKRRQE